MLRVKGAVDPSATNAEVTLITTIILNWNRAELLQKTVESYLATAGENRELFIVDNASTDGSREYLRGLEANAGIRVFCLDANEGGAAYNRAIAQAQGDLIHLCENDVIFQPGWFEHVEQAFEYFPTLGQLSLFCAVPTDEEAWDTKPSHLVFARGKILYQAHANVTTTSILRASLFHERGIKVRNIEHGSFRFPDDVSLSADVKTAGFGVAWSDRYYVRNVGHEVAEFEQNPEYYEQNYASKPWVGVQGWRNRVERQKALPRPMRASVSLPERTVIAEKTPQPVRDKAARLWSMFDSHSAETEVVDFLFALTRLIKPAHVLETGTWLGLTACALARALMANGFGEITTVEIQPEIRAAALENFGRHGVSDVVNAVQGSSMVFVPDRKFDMALFDSDPKLRVAEFLRFKPYLNDGAVVVFRDTAMPHGAGVAALKQIVDAGLIAAGANFPTPRGLFVGMVKA
jgi:predicted O-methyltransferase YrrM